MKVSVVVTVLNEELTIGKLLLSLYKQTLKPDEIVIVDGGSTDATVYQIKLFSKKYRKIKVQLIEESGNISVGRNIGISKARNDIIAMTDAGCVANKFWLSRITSPFVDNEIGIVAGFYKMKAISTIQKAVAPFLGVPLRKFDPRSYLPSARSMAFRKEVWSEVGGFNEKLARAGEDTLFNYSVIKKNIKIFREPNALVSWEVPVSFAESIKKFYAYAKGDAETHVWWHPTKKLCTHNIKVLSIFVRYFLFLSLIIFSFIHPMFIYLLILVVTLYLFWSIWKLHDDVPDTESLLLVPVIQVLSDLSVMSGFISGIIGTYGIRA